MNFSGVNYRNQRLNAKPFHQIPDCLISLLSQVIWRKASQPNPITVGELTYVADERFKLHHIPDKGEWNLFIKNIQHSDAGMYECQISSKEKYIRKLIQVNVIGKIVSKFSIYTGLIDVERMVLPS